MQRCAQTPGSSRDTALAPPRPPRWSWPRLVSCPECKTLLTARSLAWRAQVCGEMLYSVPGDGPHRDGGICKERPRRPDHVAAALAVLCGRPLPAVVRQFAPNDKHARYDLKRGCEHRCSELTQLEAALATRRSELIPKTNHTQNKPGVFQHHPSLVLRASNRMDTGCQPERPSTHTAPDLT